MSAWLAGFGLSFSLILAIGAQNAFVLRQGLKKQHVFLVCLICALSDAILIAAGVVGFGSLVAHSPWIEQVARYAGAAFLMAYGLISFHSALTKNHSLQALGQDQLSASAAALTCAALTWLNPHVYLDTVLLLGSIATQYPGAQFAFGFGAVTASFTFFFALGYGAAVLRPLFARPSSWKVLDALVGAIMLFIAVNLVRL